MRLKPPAIVDLSNRKINLKALWTGCLGDRSNAELEIQVGAQVPSLGGTQSRSSPKPSQDELTSRTVAEARSGVPAQQKQKEDDNHKEPILRIVQQVLQKHSSQGTVPEEQEARQPQSSNELIPYRRFKSASRGIRIKTPDAMVRRFTELNEALNYINSLPIQKRWPVVVALGDAIERFDNRFNGAVASFIG